MTSSGKDPVLVVLQLSGGNDYLNTVIPYTDPLYWDNRPVVNIPEDQIIPLDDQFGFNPSMAPIKDLWDVGKVAIIHGVGWGKLCPIPLQGNGRLAHLRARYIGHGGLGRTGHPRSGPEQGQRTDGHQLRRRASAGPSPCRACPWLRYRTSPPMAYSPTWSKTRGWRPWRDSSACTPPTIGSAYVMDYLSQTGLDALKGADILRTAPDMYSSTVEYSASPIAKKLKDIAQVHLAGFGTRIFYTQHAGFDTHASELKPHAQLWKDLSEAVYDFYQDLREHDASDNVVVFMFTEFGRRVHDNGSGTDHGGGWSGFRHRRSRGGRLP